MRKKLTILSALVFTVLTFTYAQSPKGTEGTFALTGATIETVTRGTIQNGTVIISDGKITAVGANVAVPQGATVIDCKGKFIYPGMIDGGSILGLSEVGSDPRTQD